jgi:zinc transport system ATP-binding protein
MDKILEVKNLSVKYGQTEALKNVSFAVEQGDFIGLAGPNGGGKTTLAKTILGLAETYSGEVLS